ncbi:MAG: CDP-diacylglycerol--glycerol-3-phosphate 3-phosphatidyltransferase [Candidatus Omnitrophica bacterium]|nr:CDP-diacylglycerol--glycerol-3-phosphate 3-phosphatidyltransferase [Candidatus Omnitrophota bacterium]MBU4478148.1 CDP-diacylglycerol--glycerol-3-phosphate 3-phosphatidyltransferase [Candidatus Omnitrophota bacterium]MCG2704055.1 CDP-diacylglycerol--glycerol-3-phosphate 3-phosphatidyltransferase [Candidatus Omnitrophota bacterium]
MNLANWISIFRVLLIPFFISAIVYYSPEKDYLRFVAVAIFLTAVVSDGVDGYIARTRRMRTRLGSFLDPLADKLLLSLSFITLALAHNIPLSIRLPLWVPILVISRDIILVLGSILVYVMTGNLKIRPSILGKLTTFFQMITILCILLQYPFSFIVWKIAVFFTVISGADYILRGSKLLNNNNHNPH